MHLTVPTCGGDRWRKVSAAAERKPRRVLVRNVLVGNVLVEGPEAEDGNPLSDPIGAQLRLRVRF